MEDMKNAMKARETIKLGTIRLLMSEVKNAEIDNGTLDEAGFQKVVAKLAKQLNESIDEYTKAGRDETVVEEKEKLAVLQAYLPAQMTDDEIKEVIAQVKADMPEAQGGRLVGAVMAQVKGKADGTRVSALVAQSE
mgnify:CR=1 FL=1